MINNSVVREIGVSNYSNIKGYVSMSIYRPTWLYIKQHNQTGLKYFGKHSGNNLDKYKGSGKYWKNHLRKHGDDVTTIWSQLFEDEVKLQQFALDFSKIHNIVNSTEWANLKEEDGGPGGLHSNKTKQLLSALSKEQVRKPLTIETKLKISKSNSGKIRSKETCKILSDKVLGKKWYNNGIITKQCLPGTEPSGWIPGRMGQGGLPGDANPSRRKDVRDKISRSLTGMKYKRKK